MELTREKILSLKAGRELDALVAEKVMGLEVHYHYYYDGEGSLVKMGPYLNSQDSLESVNTLIPPYSTDMSAAWEVEEVLSKQEGHMQIGYVREIYKLLDIPFSTRPLVMGEGLKLVRLTPEQRCKATLLSTLEFKEALTERTV